MADTPAPPQPLALDSIEATGTVRFGRPVARVIVYYRDGGRSSLDMPPPEVAPGEEVRLTRPMHQIVNVMLGYDADAKVPGKTIAEGVGATLAQIGNVLADMTKLGVLDSKQGSPGYIRGPRFPAR